MENGPLHRWITSWTWWFSMAMLVSWRACIHKFWVQSDYSIRLEHGTWPLFWFTYILAVLWCYWLTTGWTSTDESWNWSQDIASDSEQVEKIYWNKSWMKTTGVNLHLIDLVVIWDGEKHGKHIEHHWNILCKSLHREEIHVNMGRVAIWVTWWINDPIWHSEYVSGMLQVC